MASIDPGAVQELSVSCHDEGEEFLATGDVRLQGHDGICTSAWATTAEEATALVLERLARAVRQLNPGVELNDEEEQG